MGSVNAESFQHVEAEGPLVGTKMLFDAEHMNRRLILSLAVSNFLSIKPTKLLVGKGAIARRGRSKQNSGYPAKSQNVDPADFLDVHLFFS